jgi:hypothetical protein
MNEVPVRLLRETLQARMPTGPSRGCLDAETVAAWADDTLGRDERQAAEAHAADCVWCQALVAAMARTSPPVEARSWWRAPMMGWLVPLTAVAAALLLWMNVPGAPPTSSSTRLANAIEQEPARPAQSAASNQQLEPRPTAPATQDAAKVNSRGATKRAPDNAPNSAPKISNPQTSTSETTRVEAPAAQAKALSEAVAGAAPPAESAPLRAAPATAASPPPPPAAVDSVAAAAPPVTVRRTTVASPLAANARAFLADTRVSAPPIVSPNLSSQWRLLPNGAVQHSTDSGLTWEVQSTGVTVMLTTGASPAPSICWLVGREGIVLLSSDGRTWRRIAFPETADLASIRATDDKSATVTTSDGRAFRTTDGGRTWTR